MIADLFIKRPKFAIVIAILMILAGGICLKQLPIAEYPEIAPTSINVQATYTGASAQVVMETLASPIEEELNGLENLLYFSSKSDNTGYDLKSLFIGSEGTLGIITKAVLKLHPIPASRRVLWLSLDSLRKIELLFCAFQKQAGHALSAFEIVHQTPLQRVAQVFPEKVKKIDTHSPWSVLVELSYSDTQDETQSADLLESLLEGLLEQGIITETVLSQSEIQCEALWAVREAVPEAHKKTGGNVKHDISVPRSRLAEFVEQTNAALAKRFSWIEPSVFGHFGDGNLHYNMGVVPGQDPRLCFAFEKEINAIVYEHVARFNGSVAAEHGVGRMKRDLIEQTKPADELQLMRKLKRIFDPDNRLNPGAVVSP